MHELARMPELLFSAANETRSPSFSPFLTMQMSYNYGHRTETSGSDNGDAGDRSRSVYLRLCALSLTHSFTMNAKRGCRGSGHGCECG